jgi:hypothetical protein
MEKLKELFWKAPELVFSVVVVGLLILGLAIYSWVGLN